MMRWRRGISVKPGRRGDWQQDGRNGEKQEWSRSNQRLRCGPLVCQWLIKVSGGSGAWKANTNSRCAVIEGLGLPQGLANTDYLERYRGIGGCERVYSVFVFVCNLFQKNIFRKEEKLNYKDNISQSLFFFPSQAFFSLSLKETHWKTVRGFCLDFSEKLSWWQSSWHRVAHRKPNRDFFPLVLYEHFSTQQSIFLWRGLCWNCNSATKR